jgi:transposase-like protein
LLGRYQYLFLDAAWAKYLVDLSAARICVLTAAGMSYSGVKEMLGFERVQVESESSWRGSFLGLWNGY